MNFAFPIGLCMRSWSVLLLLGMGWVPAAAAERAGASPIGRLVSEYWVPRSALTESEQAALPGFCAGGYRWPVFAYPTTIENEDYPVQAEARKGQYWEDGRVTLEGEVKVTQGNRTLYAPQVNLNHVSRTGTVDGGLLLEEPDVILRGDRARMELDSKATQIEGVEFLLVEPEFRGSADLLDQDAEGNLQIERGTFTRCEPNNDNWRISAKTFTVEDGSIYGVARDAVLRVKNVPVFYTPYLSIPVTDDRKSGWLFPNMGYSSENGFEFGPPYYLNLAPNYDATVIPRYLDKRGVGLDTEFRHKSSWQETELYGAYLPDDEQYDGIYEKKDYDDLLATGQVTEPFQPADRWLYAMFHEGDLGNFHSTVDYTAVSDRDYFRNLGTELDVSSQRELERRGEILYTNGGLDLRLWAQRFDRLDDVTTDPYQRVPELALSYVGAAPIGLEWSLGASAASFDRHNEDLSGAARVVGDRFHAEPRVQLPLQRSWGFLTLTGGYRFTEYHLEDVQPGVEEDPSRNIGLGSLDTGLFFERDLKVFGTEVVQTIEPRLFYLYQQYRDQDDLPQFDVSELTFRYDQLYRDNRFSGFDRIGDADQLSAGLTSRFLQASTGAEYLRASLGQIRYFKDRRVTISGVQDESDLNSSSELAAELTAYVGPWAVGGNAMWDPHEGQINEGSGYVRYRSDNDRILYLGYRYQRLSDVDQTDVAMTWPISSRYSLIGRWNYDLNSGRSIEALGGIEYNDCCWKIRVIARHYLDSPSAREFDSAESQQGIYLQVVFKGLASLGGQVESLLAKSIQGYSVEN